MYTILTPLLEVRQLNAARVFRRQKEVKKRYSLKNLQKRLSKQNDVNAVTQSSAHQNFVFHCQIFSQLLHAQHTVSLRILL